MGFDDELERGIVITSSNEELAFLTQVKNLLEKELPKVIVDVRLPNYIGCYFPSGLASASEVKLGLLDIRPDLAEIGAIVPIKLLAQKVNRNSTKQFKSIEGLGFNSSELSETSFRPHKYAKPNQPYMPYKSRAKKSKKSRRGTFNAGQK